MAFSDIFRINEIKNELDKVKAQCDSYEKVLRATGKMEYAELQKEVENLKSTKIRLESQITDLDRQISLKKKDLIILDDEILLQSFGIYTPKYNFENSEIYKTKLDELRDKQRIMVKNDMAVTCSQAWTVNGSQKEGHKMIHDYVKLILRSFNNECDASIINVKYNNAVSIENKLVKAYETLNKLGSVMNISISHNYLQLKLQELYLYYEYQVKKQDEKEEQKRIREQMREEAKLAKEIEEAKLKIEKEEKHFNNALEKLEDQISAATTDVEKALLEEKKKEIQEKLEEVEKWKEDVLYREQHTRAGYVYIISNIGSFGENVYKIGVTRRLDPTERVDELGDASVPFNFDIHAMIFSDDAPALETALHKAFEKKKLNFINLRREFFNVSLDEIEEVVKQNYNKTVEFIHIPEAAEYRQSLALSGRLEAAATASQNS